MVLTFGQLAGLIAALAFVVLVVFMCLVLHKLGKTINQLSATLTDVTHEATTLSADADRILKKTDDLMADINAKSQKLEPLVDTAVALSKSVDDLNTASRKMVHHVASAREEGSKLNSAVKLGKTVYNVYSAVDRHRQKKAVKEQSKKK
ncbi:MULTISPECIES: DUF948 domain-containing protein [unclassified Ligilactobacillus]|uniref:DUF948 domain-containing protein n=1 Tax=unclassified Ligilactobacillus TaxID=2767920 RepID=UPI003854FADE